MKSAALKLSHLESRDAPSVVPVGPEYRANVVTTNVQAAPAIAMDADGDYIVVWDSYNQDGDGFGVYGRRYDKNGVAQTPNDLLINSVTTEWQRSPAVAMDAAGSFVVVFESFGQDGAGYGIYARRYNASGVAQGAAFLVNTTTTDSQVRPSVAMDSDGDFVVAWESYVNGTNGTDIFFQRYDKSGAAQGVETRANSITTQFQANPAVAMEANGDFVVCWQSYTTDGDGYGIYARRYDAAGAALSANDFQVSQQTTGQQQEPAIALDMDGDFVIAWESYGQDGSRFGVYARRYNSAGVSQGNEFLVNSFTSLDQRTPSVAMDSIGDFVITWSSLNQEGPSYGIYAQRYLPNGATDGDEFHVNTWTTEQQTRPAVASDQAGNFVAVWQSEVQDGSASGVYSQRFRTAFPPRVQSFMVNDGSIQRSRVTSVTVTFDQVVNLPATPSDAFTLVGTPGNIEVMVNTSQSTSTQTIARLTFTGPGTTAGSVDDGNYTLTMLATEITSIGGQQLDGNGDGNGGDNHFRSFHRLFGDADGNRSVTTADFATFRSAFGTGSGSTNFLGYLDYDGNGFIDINDFLQFRPRFGSSV